MHFTEDGVTEDIREDMLDLCQALVLLVVLVAQRDDKSGKRQTSEATASAYVKPDLPLIESVNFF